MPNNVHASLSYVPETQHVSLTAREFEQEVSVVPGGGYIYRGEHWPDARIIHGEDIPHGHEYRLSRLPDRPNWTGSATGRWSEDPITARWIENAYMELRRHYSNDWAKMIEKASVWGKAVEKAVKTSVVAHGNCRIIYVMPAGPYRGTMTVKKKEKPATCKYKVRWSPTTGFGGFEVDEVWTDELTFVPSGYSPVGVAAA